MADADRVADWVGLVDEGWPERDAASWDATGLQVGDPQDVVSAVLVCLDVTRATLDEAAALGADLVLAHHPLLFRPLERLTPATASGALALRAARAGIAVLAAHTNLDVAVPGTSDPVAELLGLIDVRPLAPQGEEVPQGQERPRVKLVTFVPQASTPAVLAALAGAGAGCIGEYVECSFRVAGTGTFRPSDRANPVIGQRGRRSEVDEDRVEVVVPSAVLDGVLAALVQAHPYEEVAWDAYPLLDAGGAPAGRGKGLGLVGDLASPTPLRVIADTLAAGLPSPALRVAGDLDAAVRRVAACGGAGDSLVGAAVAVGADVYVTGDLRHHVVLDATTLGLATIDAGHAATEAAALPAFVEALARAAARRGLSARLLPSRVGTQPWAAHPTRGTSAEEGAP